MLCCVVCDPQLVKHWSEALRSVRCGESRKRERLLQITLSTPRLLPLFLAPVIPDCAPRGIIIKRAICLLFFRSRLIYFSPKAAFPKRPAVCQAHYRGTPRCPAEPRRVTR